MEMDLLSSYDDETSNNEQISNSISMATSGSLQSEWENFEKSIECSSPTNSSDGHIAETSKSEESSSPAAENNVGKSLLTKGVSVPEKDDDEDESHLPPGVRKINRCHSSSSSSEDEVAKDKEKELLHSDISSSDDSVATADHSKVSEKNAEATIAEIQKSSEEREKRNSKKVKHGRSKPKSRSRSPHRKRRLDDHHGRRSRSGSRSKHHRTERRRGSHRSRSNERKISKEKDHHRGHKEKKRSRTHSRERHESGKERMNSHDRSKRSRSKEKRKTSPGPRGANVIKYGDKVIKAGTNFGRPPPSKPMTFKEKMRQQLIKAIEEGGDASQALTSDDGTVICTQSAGTQQIQPQKKPPAPLMTNVSSTPGLTATINAAEAAMQSMLAFQKETTEKTGVEIPKYYNPAAINPVRYAEQVQKRKLLWSKNKDKDVNSQWHATSLSSDHDDKSKEKFRKLMGIKSDGTPGGEDLASDDVELKQKELFEKLDKEYQFARMATHTHRGVGLGFGSSSFHPPNS